MKSKFSLKKLFDSDLFIRIFSVAVAIICWIIAAANDKEMKNDTVYNVPVNIKLRESTLANLGLDVIEIDISKVDVKVNGPRTVVGQLRPEDFSVTVNVNNITEKGTYPLEIVSAAPASELDYRIIEFVPNVVEVKLDSIEKQSIRIEPVINGLSFAPGFTLGKYYANPESAVVRGVPTALAKIAKCVAVLDLAEPLDRSVSATCDIVLLDAAGEEIDLQKAGIAIDEREAQLVIQTLKESTLPLEIGLLNVPKSFPQSELLHRMTVTPEQVTLAGPADMMDNIREIRLGDIDIRTLMPGVRYTFDVPLPGSDELYSWVDNVKSATVIFDDSDWGETSFNVRNVQVINVPDGYNVQLMSDWIYDVKFTGVQELLDEMTSDDIVAEVDLSKRSMVTGSQSFPVKISAPTKGLVWAVQEYSIFIDVVEE